MHFVLQSYSMRQNSENYLQVTGRSGTIPLGGDAMERHSPISTSQLGQEV